MTKKKPLALIIMDGWGDNPIKDFNAVSAAKTPKIGRASCRERV